ncbi:MAG: hypothetical protein JW741_28535 [Sedimentisphaerales bacterium]|nr:hypothetical protein [Sedimentisphaerales bacterium]
MNKPNINIKEILKKLSFLKNNISLLVSILIAVVALLLFIPTKILGSRLRKTVETQSVQTGRTIANLIDQVPQAAQAKQMESYINSYARDVNEIERLMRETTLRNLLSYRLFPDTNERTTLLYEDFGRRYLGGIDAMLQGLNAGGPPVKTEIDAELKNAPQPVTGAEYGGGLYTQTPGITMGRSVYGQSMGGYDTSTMSEPQRKIFETICREKAMNANVYASPADVAGYLYWADWTFENRDAAYRDCWYWQIGYWIVEDVIATIDEMNKGTVNVMDAPVKRLMNLDFVLGRTAGRSTRRSARNSRSGSQGENPIYVTSAKNAMTTPCTGRYTNADIDVVHFNVRVVVQAKDTMAFMKQLCSAKEHQFRGWKGDQPPQTFAHNQISILESGTSPVVLETVDHSLYRYGDAPVVELDLICEYLFNKSAYDDVKPQLVKDDTAGTG